MLRKELTMGNMLPHSFDHPELLQDMGNSTMKSIPALEIRTQVREIK